MPVQVWQPVSLVLVTRYIRGLRSQRSRVEFVRRHQQSIPLGCPQTPVRRTAAQGAIPRSYVLATRSGMGAMAERARGEGVPCYETDAGHMLTITAPEETAALLLELATGERATALAG